VVALHTCRPTVVITTENTMISRKPALLKALTSETLLRPSLASILASIEALAASLAPSIEALASGLACSSRLATGKAPATATSIPCGHIAIGIWDTKPVCRIMCPRGIAQPFGSVEMLEPVAMKEGTVDEESPAVPVRVPAPAAPSPAAPAAKIEA
jgi:hypothetical protein